MKPKKRKRNRSRKEKESIFDLFLIFGDIIIDLFYYLIRGIIHIVSKILG